MKKYIKSTAFALAVATAAILSGCGQIESGEAGFFTEWGEVTSKQPLDEGLHFFVAPGKDLVVYNVRNQVVTAKTPVFTKDVQAMDVEMTVTYSLQRDKVIDLHTKTGQNYKDILVIPSILGATKNALGKMEAGDIVANREKATEAITQEISKQLEPHGINIVLVNLTNIDYSDAFEKAVEEKQVALQQSQKEKNETARLREVAEQEVVKAEADAKAKVLQSEAEAKAILVKAEAEAKSIKLRNEALASSHALIEYETVKAWDGKLPVQMLGNAPVPFLNLEKGSER